jgi:hypothetical protein
MEIAMRAVAAGGNRVDKCFFIFLGSFRAPGGEKDHHPAHAVCVSSDDDRPFIVLTETKFSKRHIPVWARYSPLRN